MLSTKESEESDQEEEMPFERVASTSDVPPGEMMAVEVGEKTVVVANVDGEFVCFDNDCTHRQGPMSEGILEGDTVECPFHGGQFNARTGEVIAAPPDEPLPTYKVQVDGDDIRVEV